MVGLCGGAVGGANGVSGGRSRVSCIYGGVCGKEECVCEDQRMLKEECLEGRMREAWCWLCLV